MERRRRCFGPLPSLTHFATLFFSAPTRRGAQRCVLWSALKRAPYGPEGFAWNLRHSMRHGKCRGCCPWQKPLRAGPGGAARGR